MLCMEFFWCIIRGQSSSSLSFYLVYYSAVCLDHSAWPGLCALSTLSNASSLQQTVMFWLWMHLGRMRRRTCALIVFLGSSKIFFILKFYEEVKSKSRRPGLESRYWTFQNPSEILDHCTLQSYTSIMALDQKKTSSRISNKQTRWSWRRKGSLMLGKCYADNFPDFQITEGKPPLIRFTLT